MDFAPCDVLRLNADPEFHRRIDSDEELDLIWKERDLAPELQRLEHMLFIGAAPSLGVVELKPPTLVSVSILSLIKSPFIVGGRVTVAHLDAALWLLSREYGETIIPASENAVFEASRGFAAVNGIDAGSAVDAVDKLLKVSFSPFKLIPSAGEGEPRESLDTLWMSETAMMACDASNHTLEDVLAMPLIKVAHMAAQAVAKRGKAIRWRKKGKDIIERTAEIMAKRLEELKLMEREELHQDVQHDDGDGRADDQRGETASHPNREDKQL
jgi:hypothetical protein